MTKTVVGIEAFFEDRFFTPSLNAQSAAEGKHPEWWRQLEPAEVADLHGQHCGSTLPGGCIPNMLAWVAALGGNAAALGILGLDAAGQRIAQNFAARNISLIAPPRTGAVSPVIYANKVSLAETSYHLLQGNAHNLTTDMLQPLAATPSDFIVASQADYLWHPAVTPDMRTAIGTLRERGAKLGVGLQCVDKDYNAGLPVTEILDNADYIFANREEMAFALTGSHKELPDNDMADQLAARSARDGTTFVVTTGKRGLNIVAPGPVQAALPATRIAVDRIICTVGAGDAVMGGTLYGIAQGLPVQDAAKIGLNCAAEILQIDGGQPPYANRYWRHLATARL